MGGTFLEVYGAWLLFCFCKNNQKTSLFHLGFVSARTIKGRSSHSRDDDVVICSCRNKNQPKAIYPSPRRGWRVVGWADILLDVIGGVESALREGCPRTRTGVSQYWFSGHFRQVFSTPMHYPALTLTATCGANRAS